MFRRIFGGKEPPKPAEPEITQVEQSTQTAQLDQPPQINDDLLTSQPPQFDDDDFLAALLAEDDQVPAVAEVPVEELPSAPVVVAPVEEPQLAVIDVLSIAPIEEPQIPVLDVPPVAVAPVEAQRPPVVEVTPVVAAPVFQSQPPVIEAPTQVAPISEQVLPADVAPPTMSQAPSAPTYGSVAEYDAAMRAANPEPERRQRSVFGRLFGGQEITIEEAERSEQQTQQAVQKTRGGMFGRISEMFQSDDPITEELWDELEELMIMADVGIETTDRLIHRTRRKVREDHLATARQARTVLKAEMIRFLAADPPKYSERTTKPYVVLVVGVNGAGKTTLIAKMAQRYQAELDKQVLLAAADTFRAAAVEQLQTWAGRINVPVIAQGQGADPGAVAFDAVQATLHRNSDVLIIDTAGRLQSKYNLMQELQKIRNIVHKRVESAPHEVLLVIDATTGQNGISQAKAFAEASGVTHLAITKLDGTAKGGIAFAMVQAIERPIKYIGTGEKIGDMAIFDAQAFVDALFAE